jgi:sugar phosphate isomerase/epimerase
MNNNITLFVSSIVFEDFEKAALYCKDNAINIEISKFIIPENLDKITDPELQKIKESFIKQGISDFVLHGACFDLAPAAIDSRIVEVTRERLTQSLHVARKLGVRAIIFHTGFNGQLKITDYVSKFLEKQIAFWKQFISDNKVDDINILLENTYEEDPEIIKAILDGVDSPYLKACIDTGHVNAYSKFNLLHWVHYLDKYLYHFHTHNNDGFSDQHRGLEYGTINFKEFLAEIVKLNKPLSLTLEIFVEKEVIESLEFINKFYSK